MGVALCHSGRPAPFVVGYLYCLLSARPATRPLPQAAEKLYQAVILSPFAVILSAAKDLRISLRVDSAKHPCSLLPDAEGKRQLQSRSSGIARPKARRAQDDSRLELRTSG
jgi:hypothetical protein